jgi:hypothetical protein
MTLTVRLDDTLEAALASYCAATGATKSLVVQESLAAYLLQRQQVSDAAAGASAGSPERRSAAYLAFSAAGLLGGGELGGVSADKAAVRARALQRLRPGTK